MQTSLFKIGDKVLESRLFLGTGKQLFWLREVN
jgi:thiazole synthase ThiGH ThiG subunit